MPPPAIRPRSAPDARQPWLRTLVGLLAVLVLTAGCGKGEDGKRTYAVSVGEVTIQGLPQSHNTSVRDTGETNAPGTSADLGVAAASHEYSLGPSGALPAQATIRIRLTTNLSADTPVVVRTRENTDDDPAFLPAELDADGAHATFNTTHFSLFTVLSLDLETFMTEFKKVFLDGFTAGLTRTLTPPTCAREDEARSDGYKIDSSKGDTVNWCLGIDNTNRRILKVTNRRGYPLTVKHPNMAVLHNQSPDPLALANLTRLGAGKNFILAPGGTATLNAKLDPGDAGGIRTDIDAAGQTWYAIETGARSLTAILTRFGAQPAEGAAETILGSAECGAAFARSLGDAFATCLSPTQVVKAYGPAGWMLAPLMVAAPVVAFFKSQGEAIASQLTDADNYDVIITRAQVPATTPTLVSPGRIGPYAPGLTASEGQARGLVKPTSEQICGQKWEVANTDLWSEFRDDHPDVLDAVWVDHQSPRARDYKTAAGIGMGSTVGDVRRAYGNQAQFFELDGEGGLGGNYGVFTPAGAIVFMLGDAAEPSDLDVESTLVLGVAVTPATRAEDVSGRIYGGC